MHVACYTPHHFVAKKSGAGYTFYIRLVMPMANPFGKVLEGTIGNLFHKEGSVLGIDIGSSSIKVVQLQRRSGAAVLETYGELSLGPYAGVEIGRATALPAEKLAEALKDVMKEANVTTSNCALSIPFAASLISLIKMPAIDEGQLRKMIPIEARKYIPVPIAEVTLDWFILPEEGRKFLSGSEGEETAARSSTDVLLVAIHNETLQKYNAIIDQAGLSASFFEIEIFSTIRSTITQNATPVMVVDMGAATTKLYIVEYGIVRSSHIVNKGSQDITLALSRILGVSVGKAEEIKRESGIAGQAGEQNISEATLLTLEYIFSEIQRVMLQHESRYRRNISSILFTGGGALLKGLLERGRKQFETEVSLGLPFARTQAPAFLEQTLLETGPSFSVAVGLALRKLQDSE